MTYTHCIWDFNGTLLDDVELGIFAVNKLLRDCGLKEIESKEEYRKKFNFPVKDYYVELGFDFSKRSYDILAKEWIELYESNLAMSRLSEGAEWLLNSFRQDRLSQLILSASEKKLLNRQIEELSIGKYFDEILGIDNIYGESKISIAEAWKRRNPNAKALFIGDTTHDIETARVLFADCFIVCAGHQCRERFDAYPNVKVFSSFYELGRYLGYNVE